jgi:uncharacterized protein
MQHTAFTSCCLAARHQTGKDGANATKRGPYGHSQCRNRLERPLLYRRRGPQLVIVDHTGVPDTLRGKGVGQALAAYAVEAARKGGWKIMPLCPFFRAQALRHKEWHDVVTF